MFSIAPLKKFTNIRTKLIQADGEPPSPRPRGSGKLLSSANGVGLALLRLEHVLAAENGKASFEVELEEGKGLSLSAYRPDWWPESLLQHS